MACDGSQGKQKSIRKGLELGDPRESLLKREKKEERAKRKEKAASSEGLSRTERERGNGSCSDCTSQMFHEVRINERSEAVGESEQR